SETKAEKFQKKIASYRWKNVSCRLKSIQSQDWQEKWKEDFKPFRLTDRIDVSPVWHRKRYKPKGREVVYIDTVLAFGTGLHETTRFMSQFIELCRGQFESFFDIGTGSGILSIIA